MGEFWDKLSPIFATSCCQSRTRCQFANSHHFGGSNHAVFIVYYSMIYVNFRFVLLGLHLCSILGRISAVKFFFNLDNFRIFDSIANGCRAKFCVHRLPNLWLKIPRLITASRVVNNIGRYRIVIHYKQ